MNTLERGRLLLKRKICFYSRPNSHIPPPSPQSEHWNKQQFKVNQQQIGEGNVNGVYHSEEHEQDQREIDWGKLVLRFVRKKYSLLVEVLRKVLWNFILHYKFYLFLGLLYVII